MNYKELTRCLYQQMPGAPLPPRDERGYLWGEVEDTEHYRFCSEIVGAIRMIASDTADRAVARALATGKE